MERRWRGGGEEGGGEEMEVDEEEIKYEREKKRGIIVLPIKLRRGRCSSYYYGSCGAAVGNPRSPHYFSLFCLLSVPFLSSLSSPSTTKGRPS